MGEQPPFRRSERDLDLEARARENYLAKMSEDYWKKMDPQERRGRVEAFRRTPLGRALEPDGSGTQWADVVQRRAAYFEREDRGEVGFVERILHKIFP